MSIFSYGENRFEGLGGKRAIDAEALGAEYQPAHVPPPAEGRMVDAVKAAVRVMQKGGSSTDIMGMADQDQLPADLRASLATTDQNLKAAARVALEKPQTVGNARIIRLGLLMAEWLRLRDALFISHTVANFTEQEARAFESRAKQLSREIYQATTAQLATKRKVPWKSLTVGFGALLAAILSWRIFQVYRKTEPEPPLEPATSPHTSA